MFSLILRSVKDADLFRPIILLKTVIVKKLVFEITNVTASKLKKRQ